MKFLFITQVWPRKQHEDNMYSELVKAISLKGHDVTVLLINEKRNNEKTKLELNDELKILKVRCGNIQKTNKYTKVISSILAGPQLVFACKKYLSGEKYDCILWALSTTLITSSVISLKHYFNSEIYLLLKEYWPQDPADLGAMTQNGLLYKVFAHIEKKMLSESDYIGTCSEAGIKYVQNRVEISSDRIEVCPNCEKKKNIFCDDKRIRRKYGISDEDVLFVFGGNMGISQGIDDMIPEIKKAAELDNTFFLLLGSGTEYEKVKNSLDGYLQKVKVVPAIDQSEFFELCCEADVGMIFLFKDYRVPNIPGKFTTYLNAGLPILAAVDKTTDAGIILEKNNCGYSCLNGDVDKFVGLVEKMRDSKELRMQMSKNAKKLFEKEYSVEVCGNKILAHFNR